MILDMDKKKLLTRRAAGHVLLAMVAATALLSACGGKNRAAADSTNDILSANMALLDGEQVPDYDLRTNDSLLRFEATVADLGRMKIGQKKDVAFKFVNVSSAPAVITRLVTTCGCTSAEYEKRPIMPGKESKISVGFEPEEKGVFFKKIFIYYARGSSPLEIAIKGEVR